MWGRRGFWSRLVSPAPPPAQMLSQASPGLLSQPKQGSCHIRQRAQIHAWSTPKPRQGQGCRTKRQRDSQGSVPHPNPSIACQPPSLQINYGNKL